MLADLDLLLIAVFCAADDLLPERAGNARRMLTDAEVVTLRVAQAIMGIPSDAALSRGRRQAARGTCSRGCPSGPATTSAAQRLADTIEALIAEFARDSPGFHDDLLLVDSTPVECARSIETTRRSQLARRRRLRLLRQPQPLLLGLSAARPVRAGRHPTRARAHLAQSATNATSACDLLARCRPHGPLTVIGDKGYAGRDFARQPPARRHDRPAPPQRRTRQRTAPRADPPTHRIIF